MGGMGTNINTTDETSQYICEYCSPCPAPSEASLTERAAAFGAWRGIYTHARMIWGLNIHTMLINITQLDSNLIGMRRLIQYKSLSQDRR